MLQSTPSLTTPSLKAARRFALTPGLKQSLRLLRLSGADLREEIRNLHESNPLLEAENTDPCEAPPPSAAGAHAGDALERIAAEDGGLREHLSRQVALLGLDERRHAAAVAVIEALDDDGYLRGAPDAALTAEETDAAVRLVLTLDPAGCGARSPAECLMAQLARREDDSAAALASAIVEQHLGALAAHDHAALRRACGCSEAELGAAVRLIRSLNPKPGSQIGGAAPPVVIPDLVASDDGRGGWKLELNPNLVPKLSVSKSYAQLLRQSNACGDREYLRQRLLEVRQLIYGVRSRNDTLLKVARAILGHQRGFIARREEGLKPLTAQRIAQQLSLHESTVSRATREKYMMTPAGLYELRYFFSSRLGGENGHSAAAAKAKIRGLLAAEDRASPLSDRRIAERLNREGVCIARRTVAKYRESMRIPVASARRAMPAAN